jgi:periplasmic protein TonB
MSKSQQRPVPSPGSFRNPLAPRGSSGAPGAALLFPLLFAGSLLVHGGLYFSVSSLTSHAPKEKAVQAVRVLEAPQPPPVPLEKNPEPPKPLVPKKVTERKPRVRNDERMLPPPADAPQPPEEIRGGLTDSLAPAGAGSSLAAAQGNSAEVGVDPKAARRPPPPPAPGPAPKPDPDSIPVSEAAIDTPAKCTLPRDIPMTDDAINAGITSGLILVNIVVSSKGDVVKATLKKGTGYSIDQVVIEALKKVKCTPGIKDGKAWSQTYTATMEILA